MSGELTGTEFARLLKALPEHCPISDEYEAATSKPGPVAWYSSQKEHLIGWFNEADGPGVYNRKTFNRGARAAYQHFQCAPGLLWLAEALGESRERLQVAANEAIAAGRAASQCAAIRRHIPWERVVELLSVR